MEEIIARPIVNLLERVEIVDMRFQKLNEEDSFNVFNLLERKFDEVHLHSRFLFEMLRPEGMHGLENRFLKKLLEHLEIDDFNLSNIRVQREYRKIDLLITNGVQAIIIENKLWAVDQPGQLQRYYEELVSMGYKDIRIYYLSIDGKDAEEYSIGTLAKHPDYKRILQNLSYEYDISNWLEACIKEAYNKAPLRETLIQYRKLIQEISGKTMGLEEQTEMVNLIAQNDNIIHAKKIAENWNHVRWHTEWRFWTNLEEIIAREYQISELQKYSDKKVTSNIHQARNRNPWFGLMFPIGKCAGQDACIFIERGVEDVYFGLTMIKSNSNQYNDDPKFAPLKELVNVFAERPADQHWMGRNYCLPRINFNSFSNEDTLRLLNDNFRTIYLNNLWMQMKSFIAECKKALAKINDAALSDIIIITNS